MEFAVKSHPTCSKEGPDPCPLVTSHQAFLTKAAFDKIARVTMGNLMRSTTDAAFLNGAEL